MRVLAFAGELMSKFVRDVGGARDVLPITQLFQEDLRTKGRIERAGLLELSTEEYGQEICMVAHPPGDFRYNQVALDKPLQERAPPRGRNSDRRISTSLRTGFHKGRLSPSLIR